ncbi:hypothetical protein BDW75DRAFT_101087 [Aspergillus navahoensis]
MPRTLPWLTGGGKVKRELDLPAPALKRTSNPRVKDETPSEKDLASRKGLLKSSPSPPSSPIHRCPSEEFLREGLDKDDLYIMVEDEFYAVAQTFTRHLHYAEYVRRKKEAKLHNADTIADIARPTDGITPMNAELRKKFAADEPKAKQKDKLAAAFGKQPARDEDAGDDLEAEASWAGTRLQDFMLSPRRVRSLAGLQKVRSSTRAAAGFSQPSGLGSNPGVGEGLSDNGFVRKDRKEPAIIDETTDDNDDLDAGVSQASLTIARSSNTPLNSGPLRRTPFAIQLPNPISPRSEVRLGHVSERQSPVSKQRKIKLSSEPRRISSSMRTPSKHRPAEVKKEQASRPKDTLSTTQAKRRFVFDDSDEHFSPSSDSLRRSSSSVLPSGQQRPGGMKKELEATKSLDIHSDTTQGKSELVFDDFDELPEPRKPSIQSERQHPLCTDTKQKKLKDKDTMSKKSRLDEVPTFLI